QPLPAHGHIGDQPPALSRRCRSLYRGPPSYVALPPWPPFPHRAPLKDEVPVKSARRRRDRTSHVLYVSRTSTFVRNGATGRAAAGRPELAAGARGPGPVPPVFLTAESASQLAQRQTATRTPPSATPAEARKHRNRSICTGRERKSAGIYPEGRNRSRADGSQFQQSGERTGVQSARSFGGELRLRSSCCNRRNSLGWRLKNSCLSRSRAAGSPGEKRSRSRSSFV